MFRKKINNDEIIKFIQHEIETSCKFLFQKSIVQYALIGFLLIYILFMGYDFFQMILGNTDFSNFIHSFILNIFQSIELLLKAFGWLYVLALSTIGYVYANITYWNWKRMLPMDLTKAKISLTGVMIGLSSLTLSGGILICLIVMMDNLSKS
jgi:uncharacterized membrane protein YjfL (UPF0719 family)